MKELLQNNKPDTQYVKKAEENQEYKLIGHIKHKRGLTLFSFNWKSGELKKAELKHEVTIDYETKKPKRKMRLEREKDCYYFYALNLKNAKRKILKLLKELGIEAR